MHAFLVMLIPFHSVNYVKLLIQYAYISNKHANKTIPGAVNKGAISAITRLEIFKTIRIKI